MTELRLADRIFVVGAGRSGLVLKTAALRLMHLGLTVQVVGETTAPAIRAGADVAVVGGSIYSADNPALAAKELRAAIITRPSQE